MQFVVFHLGKDRYGLNTEHVTRVLPLMELKQLPKAPDYVAGLMNFHGVSVPVIDLCALAYGTSCPLHFDTRILLVEYRPDANTRHMLGLVAERVTGVERVDFEEFCEPGVSMEQAPFLGKITARDGVILQLVNVDQLLSAEVRAILYPCHPQAAP